MAESEPDASPGRSGKPGQHVLPLLLGYPFELAIPVALSAVVIQSLVDGQGGIDQRLDGQLGDVLSLVWQIGVLLGSAVVLFGLLARPWAISRSAGTPSRLRAVERTGCLMISTVSAVYAVVVIASDWPLGVISGTTMGAVSAGFALRSLALGQVDKAVLARLRALHEQD